MTGCEKHILFFSSSKTFPPARYMVWAALKPDTVLESVTAERTCGEDQRTAAANHDHSGCHGGTSYERRMGQSDESRVQRDLSKTKGKVDVYLG